MTHMQLQETQAFGLMPEPMCEMLGLTQDPTTQVQLSHHPNTANPALVCRDALVLLPKSQLTAMTAQGKLWALVSAMPAHAIVLNIHRALVTLSGAAAKNNNYLGQPSVVTG